MDNQFEHIDLELKALKPAVKEKALEILAAMDSLELVDSKEALKKAIEQAENWFMDSEG